MKLINVVLGASPGTEKERTRERKEECVVVKRSCSVLGTSSLIQLLSDGERGKVHGEKERKTDSGNVAENKGESD